MADVFISYKRDEREAVGRVAQELRGLGLEVWFDTSLSAGEAFSDTIDREAHGAKAVLVCWSPAARTSQWVKAEALIGFEERKLVACYLAGPDGFKPPAPFNSIHAEDLRAWLSEPSAAHAGWKSILRRVGKLCKRADIESYGALDIESVPMLRAWLERHGDSPLFAAVDALLGLRDAEENERSRLEQEARERRIADEEARLAREEADRIARAEAARRTGDARAKADRLSAERHAHAQREEDARRANYEAWRSAQSGNRRERSSEHRSGLLGKVVALAVVAGVAVAISLYGFLQRGTATIQGIDDAAEQVAALDGAALRDGQQFDDCNGADWCPRMVVIPSGAFNMGAGVFSEGYSGGTIRGNPVDNPTHEVSVSRFAAGMYEVTRAQWAACVADGGCSVGNVNPEHGDRPIGGVTWRDATDYVRWLAARTARPYRLMTEAEWEYAARGNANWFDQNNRCDFAHVRPCAYEETIYLSVESLRPVGTLGANPFGLHDVFGNVSEWVEDCYLPYAEGTPADGSANVENCRRGRQNRRISRVCRGGDLWIYQDYFEGQAAGFRGFADEMATGLSGFCGRIGLRVARSLD